MKKKHSKLKTMQINSLLDFIHKPFTYPVTRFISIVLALLLSALLLVNPNHIADSTSALDHGYLTVLMVALSAAFVHGIGFDPRFWLWKIIFSPYFAWVILFTFVIRMFV